MKQTKTYGYLGKMLRVDLTKETIDSETLDEATLRKYVGGTSLGARFLYDEVPPGVEWSDPEKTITWPESFPTPSRRGTPTAHSRKPSPSVSSQIATDSPARACGSVSV